MGRFYFRIQGSVYEWEEQQEVGMHSNTRSLNMVHAGVFGVVGRLLYGTSTFSPTKTQQTF